MIHEILIAPFQEFEFMRRALVGVCALALGAGPIGVFLMLRRMSLVGDAMAHAILPGAAIGFLISGLNLYAMTAGGLIAGFVVALLAGLIARVTELKEDASLAVFFLISLAVGVTIVSMKGTNIDLLHFLFGNVLALDNETLTLIAVNASITVAALAVIYRPLVIECVDPNYLRSVSRLGGPAHLAFMALVVINLVSGFQALGTLLGVGIMMVPAAIGRFWARDISAMIMIAVGSGIVSGYGGLVLSFHSGVPSGPARADEAVRLARACGSAKAFAHALIARVTARVFTGDSGGLAEAQAAAAKARDFLGFTWASDWTGNCLDISSASRDVIEHTRRGRDELTALGGPHCYVAKLSAEEAFGLALLGDWRACVERLRVALGSTPGPRAT